jgi:hypothetical protein
VLFLFVVKKISIGNYKGMVKAGDGMGLPVALVNIVL